MAVDVAAQEQSASAGNRPPPPPPPSPTLHEALHDDDKPEQLESDAIEALHIDDSRRSSHSTKAGSLKAAFALPPKPDLAYEQRLPVETLGAAEEKELTDDDIDFPDGGFRAWLVVAGAVHMTFACFGMTNSWGVWQAYYMETGLSGQSASSLAWIGSLQYCLIFVPAVVLGRLMDIGIFLLPFTCGCVTYVVSLFLAAQTTEFYQVLLAQGVLVGISAGVLFGPTLAIVAHWFKKRRALAFGVTACGSSMGGTVFPILIRQLLPRIGYAWTQRVCGFLILYLVTFGWFTLRPRLPPKNVKGGMFNFGAFKTPTFSLYVAGCFLIMLGLYTPLSYIDVSGTAAGLGSFSSYLVSIANASSILGRIIPGYFGDKVGPVNMLLPASFLAGIMMFIWPICVTRTSLIVFAIFYGAATGAFVSLFSPGVAQLGETHDVGRRMGMLTTCLSLAALVGPPISGAILGATGESYMHVAGFSGSVVFSGVGLLFAARYLVLGGLKGRM